MGGNKKYAQENGLIQRRGVSKRGGAHPGLVAAAGRGMPQTLVSCHPSLGPTQSVKARRFESREADVLSRPRRPVIVSDVIGEFAVRCPEEGEKVPSGVYGNVIVVEP